MKILPLDGVKIGMRLGQNIYRHDGLLALPKGAVLTQKELHILKYYTIDFVLVTENTALMKEADDTNATVNIMEAAFQQSLFWPKDEAQELYHAMERKIVHNKRLLKYLVALRDLDSYSYAHCVNVCMVVASILTKSGKKIDDELTDILVLTLFHDIGRIKMGHIFNKEGKLDEKEYIQLMKHPQLSLKMLKKAGYSDYELKFVGETHERWNGSGYPDRLAKEDISDLAQLVFIADVYNALSSYRPYRGIYSPYDVLQIIEAERDKAFGSQYVDIFLERFNPYPIGCLVELSNGELAHVKKILPDKKVLPIVEVLSKDTGEQTGYLDLSLQREIRIAKIVHSY